MNVDVEVILKTEKVSLIFNARHSRNFIILRAASFLFIGYYMANAHMYDIYLFYMRTTPRTSIEEYRIPVTFTFISCTRRRLYANTVT